MYNTLKSNKEITKNIEIDSDTKQEIDYKISNQSDSITFFKTTKLNNDIKSFTPQTSMKKKGFRNSKAHRYRQLVASDCKIVKDNILKEITKENCFLCPKCDTLQPLQYARLEHVIPLKQLWTNFEKKNNIEMDCHSPDWKRNGRMVLLWKDYHNKNAKLCVLCKDCEKTDPKKLLGIDDGITLKK